RLAPVDRFVGREAEVDGVRSALAVHRVVTVVGPGGAGKTRLVQELLDGDVLGPALLVELAAASSGDEVPSRLAAALGLRAAPEGVASALADALARRDLVLVLDNCEHVAGAVALLVRDLLGVAPGVRVLATSRARLGLPGERLVRLGPLATEAQV